MQSRVWIVLAALVWHSAGLARSAEPDVQVTTKQADVKIIKIERVQKGWWQNEAGKLPARESLKAVKGRGFLRVRVEADFPAGSEWMLAGFVLREEDTVDRPMNEAAIPFVGISVPGQPAGDDVFYRAESGAAAVLVEGKVLLLANRVVDGARRVRFTSLDAGEGHWPGGRATVDLLFSIPAKAEALELLRLQIIRISKSDPARPDAGAPLVNQLEGPNEVRIVNPNDFTVQVFLRVGDKGRDFKVPVQGAASVRVPDGAYTIFFKYSNEPDALYQGDGFTLRGTGVEIRIVRMAGGNYPIRRVG